MSISGEPVNKRLKVITEIYQTEKIYQKQMSKLDEFLSKILAVETLSEKDRILIESYSLAVKGILNSPLQSFISDFELSIIKKNTESELENLSSTLEADLLGMKEKGFYDHYRMAIVMQELIDNITNKNTVKNKDFLELLQNIHVEAVTESVGSLQAYVILPVQRLPRYMLLLADLIKYTPSDNIHNARLIQARESVQRALKVINNSVPTKDKEADRVLADKMLNIRATKIIAEYDRMVDMNKIRKEIVVDYKTLESPSKFEQLSRLKQALKDELKHPTPGVNFSKQEYKNFIKKYKVMRDHFAKMRLNPKELQKQLENFNDKIAVLGKDLKFSEQIDLYESIILLLEQQKGYLQFTTKSSSLKKTNEQLFKIINEQLPAYREGLLVAQAALKQQQDDQASDKRLTDLHNKFIEDKQRKLDASKAAETTRPLPEVPTAQSQQKQATGDSRPLPATPLKAPGQGIPRRPTDAMPPVPKKALPPVPLRPVPNKALPPLPGAPGKSADQKRREANALNRQVATGLTTGPKGAGPRLNTTGRPSQLSQTKNIEGPSQSGTRPMQSASVKPQQPGVRTPPPVPPRSANPGGGNVPKNGNNVPKIGKELHGYGTTFSHSNSAPNKKDTPDKREGEGDGEHPRVK